jgi:hypothetical protein
MVRHISTDAVFALPGFSPAVAVSSELILVSGQVAIGLDGEIVGRGDFEAQVKADDAESWRHSFSRRSFLQRCCSRWGHPERPKVSYPMAGAPFSIFLGALSDIHVDYRRTSVC